MRTNIVIDDELMKEAQKLSGLKTKREVVDMLLRRYVKLKRQEEIKKYRGKLKWTGDLESMRRD